VIHITGSKGKGSVSSYTNSILRQVAPDAKIGMFTSPELVTSRERFLLNGNLITEEDFASTFFDIWDALAKYDRTDRPIQRPGWCAESFHNASVAHLTLTVIRWWYVCMMAFHYYVKKQVDCLILEVGIGGRYDATNEVLFPLVTAVTHLALEHTDILGNTIEDIAYAKAGIVKVGIPGDLSVLRYTYKPLAWRLRAHCQARSKGRGGVAETGSHTRRTDIHRRTAYADT
jgi:folylpolyglutamate synthase